MVDGGKEWHREHHSENPRNATADNDGSEYPDTGETNTLAHNQWVGNPVVELLEDNDKD